MPRRVHWQLPDHVACFRLELSQLPRDGDGRVAWPEVYSSSDPLRIEIGVGNSPFLIEVAQLEPSFCYLGFEYGHKRVVKFLKKLGKSGVTNIRIFQEDARQLLPKLFVPGTVDHFFINHPDPWPKRRHAKKRLILSGNVILLGHLLRMNGGVSLRTDVRPYAEQMLAVLDSSGTLENRYGKGRYAREPRYPFETPFEEKFRSAGKPIYYLEYQKVAEPAEFGSGEPADEPGTGSKSGSKTE